jgi:asparagine synthase (glutamine-hydrolysing)
MSVQFGRWNLDGKPLDRRYLEQVGAALEPYGPDGAYSYTDKDISILYQGFLTTNESRHEVQPHICSSGAVITWDGRLDNRADLIRELAGPLTGESTDVAIVAAVYEQWSTRCFSKLVGDWELSIWDSKNRSLILAKDPIGTRHLYYRFDAAEICWSTILDPLVRLAGRSFALDEEYIAGWLSMSPATHLTPWVGVHSVPPSSFVRLWHRKHVVSKYWDFAPNSKISYKTDGEYEEHFRTVFAVAVQRRLRSDRPILAELSGGRDSSSIVCMADLISARGGTQAPRLDTISWYDDLEPKWDDRPFFAKVEQVRGRQGWHIDIGLRETEETPVLESPKFNYLPLPDYDHHLAQQMSTCLVSQGNRVVLSGTGGDETMGGVPTPIPELQDLLRSAEFRVLVHQLKAWALEKRKPWIHLLLEAASGFLPPEIVGAPKHLRPSPWFQSDFVKRNWTALTGYPCRVKLFGSGPSFQDRIRTLDGLRRQLASKALPFEPPYEKRYPYLDRDLLEFAFAIPQEQLVRPTQRRSLMRRALRGIVPDEILNRKRKAVVARAPLVAISRSWTNLVAMSPKMVSNSLGLVDSDRLLTALRNARYGQEFFSQCLTRTIYMEDWLRHLFRYEGVKLDTVGPPDFALHRSTQS